MQFDFTEIVMVLAPRAFFTSSSLHDDSFDFGGVRDCIAQPIYALLGASEKLRAVYPECAHDFPVDVRAKVHAVAHIIRG